MRVLFDAFWWDEGPIANRTVQRQIIEGWVAEFPSDAVAIAGRGSLVGTPPGVESFRTRAPLQALSNAFELPRLARRWDADVVITHNFASPTHGSRSVVFIHDLMFLDRPDWFTPAENAYFRLMKLMARRADLVTTSSQSEATRIRRYLPARRVEAIGLALSDGLANAIPAAPELPPHVTSFALAVGRLNVRKNLAILLRAAIDSGSFSSGRPLLVVGESSGKAADFDPNVREAIEQGVVIFTGRVSDGELRWLYSNSTLFLFLSLEEGFGLPCLEAAHFGAPAIVSDIPVFREILGDSARFVSPTNKVALRDAIRAHFAAEQPAAKPTIPGQYAWPNVVNRLRSEILAQIGKRASHG